VHNTRAGKTQRLAGQALEARPPASRTSEVGEEALDARERARLIAERVRTRGPLLYETVGNVFGCDERLITCRGQQENVAFFRRQYRGRPPMEAWRDENHNTRVWL
jgi:hypothetical protein